MFLQTAQRVLFASPFGRVESLRFNRIPYQVVAGAGLTLLEWGPSRGDPQAWRGRLVNVWTHPDWRRRRLAQGLVTRCLHSAQERGISRISLGTSEQARSLYGRLGFRASETEMWLCLPTGG